MDGSVLIMKKKERQPIKGEFNAGNVIVKICKGLPMNHRCEAIEELNQTIPYMIEFLKDETQEEYVLMSVSFVTIHLFLELEKAFPVLDIKFAVEVQ